MGGVLIAPAEAPGLFAAFKECAPQVLTHGELKPWQFDQRRLASLSKHGERVGLNSAICEKN